MIFQAVVATSNWSCCNIGFINRFFCVKPVYLFICGGGGGEWENRREKSSSAFDFGLCLTERLIQLQ